jgi:hypothetical protein
MPSTLHECFTLARQQISEEDLDVFAKSERHDLADFHFGLGMSVRNQWLYPEGSVLGKKFFGIGIIFPDNMSSIVVYALWLDLNGHEITPSTLRELEGWPKRSKYDRKEEEARLVSLIGTADS